MAKTKYDQTFQNYIYLNIKETHSCFKRYTMNKGVSASQLCHNDNSKQQRL
jgi:hypothetical protein